MPARAVVVATHNQEEKSMKVRALMVVVLLAIGSLRAQQESNAKSPTKAEATREVSTAAYRFQYSLTELNGKQKISERRFEILTSDRGSVQSSSRLAVATGSLGGTNTQYTYVDIGLNASMHFTKSSDGTIQLGVEVSMSFVAPAPSTSSLNPGPDTRTIKMQVGTDIRPGVPTIVGTIEDVASAHVYELSVTATPR
jgi:hypothetical protein